VCSLSSILRTANLIIAEPSQLAEGSTLQSTSTNPQTMANITHMPPEILLNIEKSLHPTAVVCLSVTCKKMHDFFAQPAASMPGLTSTVLTPNLPQTLTTPSLLPTKHLWEMLQGHMTPRIWAGHYGVDTFVDPSRYQEIRDQYWSLHPQRPYNIEEASPFVRPGGEAINVEEEVAKMTGTSLSQVVRLKSKRKVALEFAELVQLVMNASEH